MREFESQFVKGLMQGLRSSDQSPVQDQALVTCRNLRPREFGLKAVEALTDPFGEAISWPFPQMLHGREYPVLADSDTIYTYDSSFALTSQLTGLAVGDCWDMADFGEHLLLANGSVMVERQGDSGLWSSFASESELPGMKTICAFNGQLVGGNVTTAWYDCGANHVVYSNIGDINCTPGLRNEAGYMIMPWEGQVQRVLPLGQGVIVYGDNGIVAIVPSQQYWGLVKLADVGIPWKGAVCGHSQQHIFVDYKGRLWSIDGQFKLEKLGYREYMELMTAGDIMISYNAGRNEFYISDGSYGYLLTGWGLCQTHQLPTSVKFVDGALYGVYSSDGDTTAQVTTDVLDFGLRAFKTLTMLEFGLTASGTNQAAVDWRSDVGGSFQSSTWIPINPTGVASPLITAHDFRLKFKSSSYTDVKLNYINSRLKLVDKRSIRGVYSAA